MPSVGGNKTVGLSVNIRSNVYANASDDSTFKLKDTMLSAADVIKLFDGQTPDNIVASVDPDCWDPIACGNLPTSRLISPRDFREMTSVTGSVFIQRPCEWGRVGALYFPCAEITEGQPAHRIFQDLCAH
jgi:hypothetical protein